MAWPGDRPATPMISSLHRLAIPLPDSPLGTVNAYAVPTDEGIRLIDCGWNTPDAYDALLDGLHALGADVSDIREILITHIHPDHYGLAERLAAESGAPVAMHRLEAVYVGARYEDVAALIVEMEAWLAVNGVPSGELEAMAEASLGIMRRVGARKPDVLLEGGELFTWGGLHLEVLWVPGHSAGLICLYEPNEQVLISSDHVLQRISPHVGLHTQSLGNPLDDYIDSLRSVRDLPVRLVLPGHGEPFTDLATRVDEILAHHDRRNEWILTALTLPSTAYEVASRLPWRGSGSGWAHLEPFQRRMAVTETIAHLEYLHAHGRVRKHVEHGRAVYQVSE